MRHRHEWKGRHGSPRWSRGPGKASSPFIFMRFMAMFGFMVLFVVGGMAVVAFLLTRIFGGDGQTALLVWIGGIALVLALPVIAITLAIRAFRGIAMPLADVMEAADRVATGDLTARVSERGPNDFRHLASSFNRMTSELQRSDQQRRNLTADVAHELRTPLHIIQGNLEGIVDGVYDPTKEHLDATIEEARLLARLVDDLRLLSLAESGELQLRREAVDIAELLADLGTTFSGQVEAAGIDLQLDAATTAAVSADADRLSQVLGNLMMNAIRHTSSGGRIALMAEPQDGGVQITLSDTGEGIPEADLPYVFDRFWKGDRSRSREGGGTGLGLAIANQLVVSHGGTLTVESTVGEGATFRLWLPAA